MNRDLDKIGGPDEVAKFNYDSAEELRLASIVADQFQSDFGQFCYRNRLNTGDELAKHQFFLAVRNGEVDLRNAPIEPEVMPDEGTAVVPAMKRRAAEPQRRIGPEPAPQLGLDETQTPYGPIVTPQTEANKWKASANPGLAWGDAVREGAYVKAEAERAMAEGRAKDASNCHLRVRVSRAKIRCVRRLSRLERQRLKKPSQNMMQ